MAVPFFRRAIVHSGLALATVFLPVQGRAWVEAIRSDGIETTAESRLKRVEAKLFSLKTLTTTMTEDDEYGDGSKQRWAQSETRAKPSYYLSDSQVGSPSKTDPAVYEMKPNARTIGDGKVQWTVFLLSNIYRDEPGTPKELELDDERRLEGFIRPLDGFYRKTASVWGDVQRLQQQKRLQTLRFAGKETYNGKVCDIIELVHADDHEYSDEQRRKINGTPQFAYRIYVGPDDLIHRIRVSHPLQGVHDYKVNALQTNKPVDPKQFVFVPSAGSHPAPEPPSLLAVGTAAPDFTTLDKNNKPVKLSDFKGKVVVLDFWATWCQPCMKALPHLRSVQKATKGQPVAFFAVCVWDDRKPFEAWIAKKESLYPFTFGFDPAARDSKNSIASKQYNVDAIPVTYVIDKEGKVAAAILDYKENDTRLEVALKTVGISVPMTAEASTPISPSKAK